MSYGQICVSVVLTALGALIFIAAIGGIIFLSREIIKGLKN